MSQNELPQDIALPEITVPTFDPDADNGPAWKMIENGRYQPRRIKGSCIGRELG